MTDIRYTENLIQKGNERKRLTKQLAQLVEKVADQIADSVPEGTIVTVDGKTLKTKVLRSNVGTMRTLGVEVFDHDTLAEEYRIFNDDAPGASYYLHNDFQVLVDNATRDEFLWFANHLPEIVSAFEAVEDDIIEALREGFEKLRKLAEPK